MYQRIQKSSSNTPTQDKSSKFSQHSLTIQARQTSRESFTQEEIENEAFNQNKFEAFGLQLKEKHGTITPIEQERLGVLQAKMDDFWVQRRAKGSKFSYSLESILGPVPENPVSNNVQLKLAKSDQLNQSIQARAFTTGQGEYQPGSQSGQKLIAHELTHVVQQNGEAVKRSPLPPQQLPQHPATETPLASARDLPLQAKGDKIGNRPDSSVEQRPNKTGMPDALKAGVESLSGYSLDDVRVHYNSPKPDQLQALAYTQGTEIHVAPGQEKHLPHEAWHVVQQKQGRVNPTFQMKGVGINDDKRLENEADVMGEMASNQNPSLDRPLREHNLGNSDHKPIQGMFGEIISLASEYAIPLTLLFTVVAIYGFTRILEYMKSGKSKQELKEELEDIAEGKKSIDAQTKTDQGTTPKVSKLNELSSEVLPKDATQNTQIQSDNSEKLKAPLDKNRYVLRTHDVREFVIETLKEIRKKAKDNDINIEDFELKAKIKLQNLPEVWEANRRQIKEIAEININDLNEELKQKRAKQKSKISNPGSLVSPTTSAEEAFAKKYPNAIRIQPMDKIKERVQGTEFAAHLNFISSTFKTPSPTLPKFDGQVIYHDTQGGGRGGFTIFGVKINDDQFLIAHGSHHNTEKDTYNIGWCCASDVPGWTGKTVSFGKTK